MNTRQARGALQSPKSKKEEQEFPSMKSIALCSVCGAAYYNKSWRHSLDSCQKLSENKKIKFSVCPACQMIKEKKYEGQAIIKNVSGNKKQDLLNLIRNIGARARKRDVMDRIIKIKHNSGGEIEILTTENQLAVGIAKQVKRAFKGKISIKWSKGESVARATVELD